eukprot:CAMPEP_0185584430 /NCGR_PEP_ID=MMETSP0434-20130131/32174_1 /TAXON_ID=626734 ORGANISM="Favella taraikaensis, Strain Fe Narragansett Bay" /NCGR_SAMPLE_ID=MMETSP0434 /ASSEMBLY_ACC=CAM_ASM_000379 /LENGTH=72 /DNA_ID=CAMNT_0028204153 /DNA_START=380 /DNA_END=598 /DNA_ORIENTATION=-
MIVEDPFAEATDGELAKLGFGRADLGGYPSRSPSPVRGVAGRSLADIKAAAQDAEDDELLYLEDDVDLDNLA